MANKIKSCNECKAGYYAPPRLDYGHFEAMPPYLHAYCAEVNDVGNATDCDLVTGFHVNRFGQLDSGVGIP